MDKSSTSANTTTFLSGIILGSLIAKWKLNSVGESWDVWVFVLALVVTLLYQVLSNYANDYGDGVKGTDKKEQERRRPAL